MMLGVQLRARVPARGTPTMRRIGLPSRLMVGAGLAPALAFKPIRLQVAFASTAYWISLLKAIIGPLQNRHVGYYFPMIILHQVN